jgi:hypothetical protein
MVHRRVAESAYRHFYYSKQKRKENLFNLKKKEANIFVFDVQLAVIVVLTGFGCIPQQFGRFVLSSTKHVQRLVLVASSYFCFYERVIGY